MRNPQIKFLSKKRAKTAGFRHVYMSNLSGKHKREFLMWKNNLWIQSVGEKRRKISMGTCGENAKIRTQTNVTKEVILFTKK